MGHICYTETMNESDFEIRLNEEYNKDYKFRLVFQGESVLSFNVMETGVIDGSNYSHSSSSLYAGKISSFLVYAQYLIDKQAIK